MSLAQELLEKASQRLDIPGDIAAGLPRLTLTGFTECSLDGSCAILEYEKTEIMASVSGGTVTVRGSGLELRLMKRQMRAREEAILAEIDLPR